MRLVVVHVAQGLNAPSKYRLKDAHSGITYPNLLTSEQTLSPVVHEAAMRYIRTTMHHRAQVRLHSLGLPPLVMSLFNFCGMTAANSEPADAPAPEPSVAQLTREIEQLKRTITHLEDRNERQARIIKAVQGAVRGDVQ